MLGLVRVHEKVGTSVIDLRESPLAIRGYRGKRIADVSLSVLGLLLLAPLLLVLIGVVRLTSPGPAFFAHERIGANGRRFDCYKFRTMCVDGRQRLEALLATDERARVEFAATQKLRDDPRVSRVGSFLRRSSLDELPQLVNVIRGDMSLVGPRPITYEELDRYGDAASDYLSVRPGLTGPWQVSGRNDLSYDRRVALDREYANTLSASQDARLILRTVRALTDGAY